MFLKFPKAFVSSRKGCHKLAQGNALGRKILKDLQSVGLQQMKICLRKVNYIFKIKYLHLSYFKNCTNGTKNCTHF